MKKSFSGIADFLYIGLILFYANLDLSIFLPRPGPTWSSRSWIKSSSCRTPHSLASSQRCSPASVSWPVTWLTSECGRRCVSGSGGWGAFMTSSCDDQPFSCALLFASAYAHIFWRCYLSNFANYFYCSAQWSLCNTIPFVDVLQYSCCYIQNLYFYLFISLKVYWL